jgi:hypothetical protein
MRRILCATAIAGWATLDLAAERPEVADLAWLAGSWIGIEKGLGTEEHWTSPAGGAMVGLHKEVRGEQMTGFEFLRIVKLDDGGIGYVASPGGAPPTTFRLTELGARSATFENPEHDFPQRIRYWLDADGILHAQVDALVEGVVRSIEWTWRRH